MEATIKNTMTDFADLMHVQANLVAGKDNENLDGGFEYRTLEDILKAVKPILAERKSLLMVTSEPILIGERYYIKATAIFVNSKGESITATATAREDENQAGKSAQYQITGSATTYASKYAICSLFSVSGGKDADSEGVTEPNTKEKGKASSKELKERVAEALAKLDKCRSYNGVKKLSEEYSDLMNVLEFKGAYVDALEIFKNKEKGKK